MVPFDFQLRTRIVFGQGTFGRLGQLARDLRFERALLVTGARVAQAGHVTEALRLLNLAGVAAIPFEHPGPYTDTAMIEIARQFAEPLRVDSIVGLGGGTSLDYARAINLALANDKSIGDIRGHHRGDTPLLPMIGVPTTAGAGSEAQSSATIVDAVTRTSTVCGDPSAAMRVALLDPELTLTAPRHVTAMAGFDAVAHAVETAVTVRRTPLSDTFSHTAWRLLGDALERVLLHPADVEARAAMLLGSHYAGMAIEQSMLGAAHACASPLTTRYSLPHGLALAMLLPHVVRWNASVALERYAALLNSPRRRARDEDAAETFARRLEDLAGAAGLAMKLSDTGVTGTDLPELAAEAARQWTGTFNPRPFDAVAAREIYRAAL